MSPRPLILVPALLTLVIGCADETPAPATGKASANDPGVEAPLDPSTPTPDPSNTLDAGADEAAADEAGEWESPDGASEDGAQDAGETAGEAAAASSGDPEAIEDAEPSQTAYPGPCNVNWTTGAKLSFEYTDGGGSVKANVDGKGKPEACGTFTIVDGQTTSVQIDEGCDGTITQSITPSYDAKSNVATASFTEGEGGKSRDITLVEVAGFTGLTPGYPIYAKRKNAKVYVRGGLARTATIKAPWQGPKMKVTFGYDKKNRVVRIKEDHEIDGSTDRRFDYRYDDMGNVLGMSVMLGSGDAVQKGRAKIDYACHEK